MVEVNFKIVIVGLICLSIIQVVSMIISKSPEISPMILFIIGMSIGVLVPSPKIDNKTGVLRW